MNEKWNKNLKRFDELIDQIPEIERKGKTMPYTSDNGHMFSLLNKDGELGIRLSKESGEKFIEEHDTDRFKSHGSFVRGYVIIPDALLEDTELMLDLFREGHAYVHSLKPK